MKEFLSQRSVPFVEREVTQDACALDELRELGVLTTSVTVSDGQVVVSFDQDRLMTMISTHAPRAPSQKASY